MELLKIFQKRQKAPIIDIAGGGVPSTFKAPPPVAELHQVVPFALDQLRLLVIRDTPDQLKERRVLIDSLSIRPRRSSDPCVENLKTSNHVAPSPRRDSNTSNLNVPASSGVAHSISNPIRLSSASVSHSASDGSGLEKPHSRAKRAEFVEHKMLGDLVFGAVSMASVKGETLKIHRVSASPLSSPTTPPASHSYQNGKDPSLALSSGKSHSQLMLSKVFPAPRICRPAINELVEPPRLSGSANTTAESDSDRDSQYSTVKSLSDLIALPRTTPIDIPDKLSKRSASPCSPQFDLSTASTTVGGIERSPTSLNGAEQGLTSPTSSCHAGGCSGSSPNGISQSLQRRWAFSQQVSFEGSAARRRLSSNASEPNDAMEAASGGETTNGMGRRFSRRRGAQIGVAVLVRFDDDPDVVESASGHFCRFLFAHMHFVELELAHLQHDINTALLSPAKGTNQVYSAWTRFCRALSELYTTPRLAEPVWLSLMRSAGDATEAGFSQRNGVPRESIDEGFLRSFVEAVERFDTKETNFFVSKLLTAVLSMHLTWTSSVVASPLGQSGANVAVAGTDADAGAGTASPLNGHASGRRQWRENVQSPYNSSWMQLMYVSFAVVVNRDIAGCCSASKPRFVRTIVAGAKRDDVSSLLRVLSYFLRSSDVRVRDAGGKTRPHEPTDKQADARPKQEMHAGRKKAKPNVATDERPCGMAISASELTQKLKLLERLQCESGGCAPARRGERSANLSGGCCRLEATRRMALRRRSCPDLVVLGAPDACETRRLTLPISHENGGAGMRDELNCDMRRSHRFVSPSCSPTNCCEASNVKRLRVRNEKRDVNGMRRLSTTAPESNARFNASRKTSLLCTGVDGRTCNCAACAERKKSSIASPLSIFTENGSDFGATDECTHCESCRMTRRPDESAPLSLANVNKILSLDSGIEESDPGAAGNAGVETRAHSAAATGERRVEDGTTSKSDGVATDAPTCGGVLERASEQPLWPPPEFLEQEPIKVVQRAGMKVGVSPTNLARSLMAGFCESFRSHFVLMGVRPSEELGRAIRDELPRTAANMAACTAIDDRVEKEAVCILANMADWSVKLFTCRECPGSAVVERDLVAPSHAVVTMTENVCNFYKRFRMAPDFCLMYIEECLGQLYTQSCVLARYVVQENVQTVEMLSLAKVAGCDLSDVPLLLAIAAVHSPHAVNSLFELNSALIDRTRV